MADLHIRVHAVSLDSIFSGHFSNGALHQGTRAGPHLLELHVEGAVWIRLNRGLTPREEILPDWGARGIALTWHGAAAVLTVRSARQHR